MTASNAASRKRRAAAVPSDQTDSVSNNGFDVYNLQGDAKAALTIFQKQQEQQTDDSTANNNMSLANKYNEILLLHISDTEQDIAGEESIEKLTREMNDLESDFRRADNDDDSSRTMSSRKRLRNELIFSYNRALVLLAQGRSDKALEICKDKLSEYLTMDSPPPEELVTVSSRMALLWLECILALGVSGTSEDSKALFKWLEKVESESDPQLKFLLNLYRSRFNLAELDDSGKHCDNKIRAARKELKQAMDLLQNKLRSSFGAETGSVVSSANSEENMSTQSVGRDHHETQPPQGSIVLQRHNQSALSLKAHSEQLKGNIKKSLILCSEAHVAAGSGASYDATHANNLAIVYETNNKRHLAVHALSKALRARQEQDNSSSRLFHLDGTARPDQTLLLKHNAAICSLHARNYHLAYEYMATCLVQSSGVFHSRPRSWLRLAEACIGVFSQLCELEKLSGPPNYSAIVVNAEPQGVVVDNALFTDHHELVKEVPAPVLASPEDLSQVKRNPLVRARATLEHVLGFGDALTKDELSSARLSLAYVFLSSREHDKALDMSKQVLSMQPPVTANEVVVQAFKRRAATARMYAAEASCVLGDSKTAMKFLVRDGQDDAIDRLASDLGGVIMETATLSDKGKRRFARAQTVVRATASSITASMGNLAAAKQLAMSAQVMEDAYDPQGERSLARRALVYTLLRGGHQGPALSQMRSLR